MRSCRFLLLAFALVLCLHAVAAVPAAPAATRLARRQDESPSESSQEPAATTRQSSRPSSSATPRPSSTTPSERPSTTRDSTTSSSIIPSESAANEAATTTSNNDQPSASSSAEADSAPKLPIQPKITPAFGLAGVILLLSGLVYAVIGIKNQWLYVFASAAYLSSLAVAVLIVYLMNPPVSNAVQGAFFVAAAITGLIFGALALVFADITDGLGCLLGGFCLSMWLLSVKDGGLITSTSGRAIFIGCMSAAGYALAWSHYTRNHGLIACISFSGATITMLGVDCFSGAGWKEFWLYLWNLNPDTFPLNTNTYPMTKGMKAELAGVVILSVLGIVSQLRLWKLIKEHREQTSAQRIEKRQAQEREEAERGRKLEDNFQKERAQWEAAYGDNMYPKPAVDSCVSTVTTTRGSFTSSSLEPTPQPKDGLAISNVQEIDAVGSPVMPTRTGSNHEPNTLSSARPSSDIVALDGVSRNISVKTLKPSAPPPLVVVPLPFKIPQEDDDEPQGSDNASVSAIPDTEEENFNGRRSLSKPLSSTSAQRHLSGAIPDHSEYEEAMIIPHIEDDRASSIAATIDEADDVSLPDLSPPHSPVDPKFNAQTAQAPTANEPGDSISQIATSKNPEVQDASTATKGDTKMDMEKSNCAEEAPTPTRAGPRQSLTVSTDPKSDASRTDQESLYSPRPRSDTVVESGEKSQQPKSAGSVAPSSNSHTEQSQSVSGSFNGALSGRLSKVTQSYRTNEWAKHLEAADTPDLDEIPVPDSPGVAVHHERPAPVPDEIAKPLTVVKRNSKRVSSDNAVYQNGAFVRSNSSTRLSQTELQSVSRSPSIRASGRLSRTGSRAHLPRVTEPSSNRISSGPLPMPDNTLLGQREALVRRRTSSQSFNLQPASTNTSIMNGEDMPLAARKRALQNKHQKPPSSSQKWQKKNGWAAGNQISGFDSHQPKRTNTSGSDQKREVLLADWKESIRQDSTPDQSAAAMAEEQRRAALNAKRQSEMEQQHQTMVAQQRDSMRQHMMRNSDMLDAHREAMRKLQAAANNRG